MSENITSTDSAESRDDKPIKKNKKQNGRSGGSEKKSKPARNLANLKTKEERNTKIFLVLSFFVPFLIMAVVFAKKGVYPFGDRQIMFSDCKQQYLPFLKEYQRKLQSGDSLFYSWHNGFGTNFMAMIGYYIASPLNLLTIFIPIKFVREAMTVFTLIKIGCSSLFTAVYLKHVYKRNDLSLVAFGCSYAFCDYIMGYYWNVIWLDSIALLPLAALGVYCVVYEKKYKLFVISLAAAFLSSYYIGFMICVFVALWFLVVSIIKKSTIPQLCEDLLKMAGYSVLALSMTLFVTLTAYAQLKYTVGADDDFPTKIQLYNNFMEVLANILSFNQPTTMEGLPNIATGMFCILMLVIFVRSKSIPMREKAAYLSLLGFLFV
ncbi:MAG: YfhO family protein, partial [Clostridia bacterium]|nr:YfhO family protein [Clostridia bacterium]